MAEPKRVPIDPGIIARATAAVSGMIRGARDGWFGPLDPLPPLAPEDVRGRQLDYVPGANIIVRPRSEATDAGIDFATLRALADPTSGGLDLLRLAIETRKDQMEAQRWTIKGRDGSDGGTRAADLVQRLRFPDGVHTHAQWQRMLIDDLLTIDAPTVYLAPGPDGMKVPQVMDGALLKKLITEDGRTPLPPEPAYSQVLKGLPAVLYSLDEVVQLPRNLRSHRIYGMSPVEQVVMTVSIALRRQMSQLEYYTAGSVPDVLLGVPESWTSTQIKEFQSWWDAILSGNTEERRRARFIPGGIAPTALRPDTLKDTFDDWLARIICFAFSLSPQALVKEMNRATADTAKEAAQEEGLEPLKLWWKDLMDVVLFKAFAAPDLELAWQDEEIADPQVKAEVCATGLGKGGGKAWWTRDEVRAKFGDAPLTPAQLEELDPAPLPALDPAMDPGASPTAPPPPPAKLAKARRRLQAY